MLTLLKKDIAFGFVKAKFPKATSTFFLSNHGHPTAALAALMAAPAFPLAALMAAPAFPPAALMATPVFALSTLMQRLRFDVYFLSLPMALITPFDTVTSPSSTYPAAGTTMCSSSHIKTAYEPSTQKS